MATPTHIAAGSGTVPVNNSPVVGPDPLNLKGYTVGRGTPGSKNYDPTYLSNRFTPFIGKKFEDIATGETTDEILKYKTGGRNDSTRKVKLAILKEYWTNSQVIGVFLLAFSIGAFIATILFTSMEGDKIGYNLFGKRGQWSKLGAFLVSLAVGTGFAAFTPHGVQTCRKKDEDDGVDRNLDGMPCIYSSDCTLSNRPPKSESACDYHRPGFFGKTLKYISYFCIIIGIIFLAAGKKKGGVFYDSDPAESIDISTSIIYGFCGGVIANYFLEH